MAKTNNSNNITKKAGQSGTYIFALLFGFIAILPQFFRGGYYEESYLPAVLGMNILFMIWLWSRKKNKESLSLGSPMAPALLVVAIIYLISISYGVDKKGSLLEFLKYSAFLELLIMGHYIARDSKKLYIVLWVIFAGGILNSIIGIGALAGNWEYIGALSGNRLNSVLQYPNTLAAYNAGLFILALSLISSSEKRIEKVLLGAFSGTMLFTFILTYSRAMWLILPMVLLLYFISQPNSRKLETVMFISALMVSSVAAAFIASRLEVGNPRIWIYFVLVIVASAVSTYLVTLLESRLRTVKPRMILILLGLTILLIGSGIVFVLNSTTEIALQNDKEENSWSALNRKIDKVDPLNDYWLKLEYTGKLTGEAEWFGRVVVSSYDNEGNVTNLVQENLSDTTLSSTEVLFSVPENAEGIRVRFENYLKGTSVTFKSASIETDGDDGKAISIPLKYKYIPEGIIARVNSISAGDSSFTRRLTFNRDGLEIIKDYFFLGAGGKGWETLYERYQQEPYTSKLTHNYFLQLWVEAGIIAFFLVTSSLALIAYLAFLTYKKLEDDGNKTRLAGMFFSVFLMLLHSAVDFNMSLMGFAFILWALIGILSGNLDLKTDRFRKVIAIREWKSGSIVSIGVALTAAVLSSTLIIGGFFADKAVAGAESGSVGTVKENLEKAVKLDPYEPTYKIDLANAYLSIYGVTGDEYYIERAVIMAESTIRNSPKNYLINSNAASFYMSIGQIDIALEHLEESLRARPLSISSYVNKLDGHITAAKYYLSKSQTNLARKSLRAALETEGQVFEANKYSKVPLTATKEYIQKFGEAVYLLDYSNDYGMDGIELSYSNFLDIDLDRDGALDMTRLYKPAASEIGYTIDIDESSYIRITNNGEASGFVYPTGITLQPNTRYRVIITARGTAGPESFKAYMWSNGSEVPNQGGLESIILGQEWQDSSFEFVTGSDLIPGNQSIRLIHSGNDDGYIDVEKILIYRIR
ncbi:O-antigen ligase family protein [Gudongella oleilytica]|uniref:O-antigen ligase family protein n=1 Tax=Gudongella oleilytica TaxID=1582259 RepID=UPI002A35E2C8|nr:O-antigen ligase family protein [Gudongella oleilytica]MDY0255882.1 O-antigen ligase family protein [Gudongella oleilytica]